MSSNTVLSNFTLSKEDIISERLNVILQYFTDNDEAVYNGFNEIPGIWKCRWYNDATVKGYDKGDFFWLNTESKSEFFKNNAEEMRETANINPSIRIKLPAWKPNDEEVFNMYNNVLTGYIDETKSARMPPWAELGELSACTQLVISQKNNNKDLIKDSTSWKNFFIEDADVERISLSSLTAAEEAIETHEENYHFGVERNKSDFNNNLQTAKNRLTVYANKDFSNTEGMYPENYLESNHSSGFDTVKYFVKKPYPEESISGYTIEHQWFRLWQSGYLEHGGLIKTKNHIDSSGKVSINFNWPISGDSSKLYDIRYIASKKSELIEIDESGETPPGDDLLSVLYEINPSAYDTEMSKIKRAPVYYANDYNLNLTPIYKTSGIKTVSETTPYINIGNFTATRNVVNTAVSETLYNKNGFALDYDSVNTPEYYSYYATGFCTGIK